IVERDQPLNLLQPDHVQLGIPIHSTPVGAPVLAAAIVVVGPDSTPVPDAEVYLFGSLLPAHGVSNQNGQATLSLFGETTDSIRGLYVKPRSDYWSFYQERPAIDPGQANIVVLRPLAETFTDFPRQQVMGWGQRAMRLDQLPGNFRGQGIKV